MNRLVMSKDLLFKFLLNLLAFSILLLSQVASAMDKCNYTFVYFHNDKKGSIVYTILNPSDRVGPSISGTLDAGSSMKFWFGSSSSKEDGDYPGGNIKLTDGDGTLIGYADYAVVWGGDRTTCMLNLSLSLEHGFTGNASNGESPPRECIPDEANGNATGPAQDDTGGNSPAVNFKICD